ncbi:MAG TPA: alkaline phosphatase family protein, partial [Pirellulaceae bacterium]|nr:alkaline phosphatase family protein [Pirellulaceae bacterium]
MRNLLLFPLALLLLLNASATFAADRPRLIVVVSVDQLCQEYFQRFHDNLHEQGYYRRAEKNGAVYTNCHHAHAFTLTAPGHSVQLTGTYPAQSGIIGNDWY